MYRSANYPTDPEAADAFVAGALHGTLIATPPGGHPQVTLLPFVKDGDALEVHCVQDDPTFAAVQANPRVTFLVSDFLSFTPHDWVDEDNAARATLHFRAVALEGEAEVSTDPAVVAALLGRLLRRYEPQARYRPLADDDFYGPRLRRLAAVFIRVTACHAKFKLGPYGPQELRLDVARRLRVRGWPNDDRSADVIESAASPGTPGDQPLGPSRP